MKHHPVNTENVRFCRSCGKHGIIDFCVNCDTNQSRDLLNTIDTLRDQLRYVEETMAPELVFHSDCKCDIASGDTPCAHCAAIHFHAWYQANLLQNEP